MTVADVWVATLATAFLSGFVPLVNIEAYLLGAAALLPGAPPLVVVLPSAPAPSSSPAWPGACCASARSSRFPVSSRG